MNGAGNDFVLVDAREAAVPGDPDLVRRLCDRRRGVGADGLILVEPHGEADFFMRFYNADGTEAGMCGNGARCAAAFAASLGLGRREDDRTRVRLATGTGPIEATVRGDRVAMRMMDARGMRLDVPVQVAHPGDTVHFVTVGTRHVLVPVDDAARLRHDEVVAAGRALRRDPAFAPEGANVNFFSVDEAGRIRLRTYEKGVEDETHACGTGSVAAAVVLWHTRSVAGPRRVVQHSGEILTVSFVPRADGATDVTLEGPVAVNFRGVFEHGSRPHAP